MLNSNCPLEDDAEIKGKCLDCYFKDTCSKCRSIDKIETVFCHLFDEIFDARQCYTCQYKSTC